MEFIVVSTGAVSERGKYVGGGGASRSLPFNGTAENLPVEIDETWENAFEMVLSFRQEKDLEELGETAEQQDEALRKGVCGAMPLVEKYFGLELEWYASLHRDTDNPHIHITYRRTDNVDKGIPNRSFFKMGGTPSEMSRLFFEGFGLTLPGNEAPDTKKKFLILDTDEKIEPIRQKRFEQEGWQILNLKDLPAPAPDCADTELWNRLAAISKATEEDGGAAQVVIISSNTDLRQAVRSQGENWSGFESVLDFNRFLGRMKNGVTLFPEYIPKTLKDLKQWGAWVKGTDYGAKEPRPTKIAVNVVSVGYKARSNDPRDWHSFDQALRFVQSREKTEIFYKELGTKVAEPIGGLSFQLREGDGLVGIDLDKCLNPETGEIKPPALEIIQKLGGYWEISPSGKGLRGYVLGQAIRSGKGRGSDSWIEVYDFRSPRYLSATGNRLSVSSLEPIENQEGLDWLHGKYLKREEPAVAAPARPNFSTSQQSTSGIVTDELIFERISRASLAGQFLSLYAGDGASGEGQTVDRSQNDYAFIKFLAFYTQDPIQLDRIFRNSGRMRPKWDRNVGRGVTYSEYVIREALKRQKNTYDWNRYFEAQSRKEKGSSPTPPPPPPEKIVEKPENGGAPQKSRNFKNGRIAGEKATEAKGSEPAGVEGNEPNPVARPKEIEGKETSTSAKSEYPKAGGGHVRGGGPNSWQAQDFLVSDQRILNVLSGFIKAEDIENDPNHVIRLWKGEPGQYRSAENAEKTPPPSYGDAQLARKLAYYTDDANQIERLMRQSERVRPEWDTSEPIRVKIDRALVKAREGDRYNWGKVEYSVRKTIEGEGTWETVDEFLRQSVEHLDFTFEKNNHLRFMGLAENVFEDAEEDPERRARILEQQKDLRLEFREVWDSKRNQAQEKKTGAADDFETEDDLSLFRRLSRFANQPSKLVELFRQSRRMIASRPDLRDEKNLLEKARKVLKRPHLKIDWSRYFLSRLKVGTVTTARLTVRRELFTGLPPTQATSVIQSSEQGQPAERLVESEVERAMKTELEKGADRTTGDTSLSGQLFRGPGELKPSIADVIPATTAAPPIDIEAHVVRELGSGIGNYRLPETEGYEYTPKVRFSHLIEALKVLKEVRLRKMEDGDGVLATEEEKSKLALFPGFGSFPSDLFRGSGDWKKECKELRSLLTQAEWDSAKSSHVNAMYTHPRVARAMWGMIDKLGLGELGNLRVLEPSVGANGVLFTTAPEKFQASNREAVELDSLSHEIASLLFPKDIVHKGNYGEVSLPRDYFDLVIGNPPFGTGRLFAPAFAADPVVSKCPNHEVFMAKGIRELREGGILIYVNSRYFMDKSDPVFRQWMADRANLVAAFRLPGDAFQKNAGTKVVTDILIFQKRGPEIKPGDQSWVAVEPLTIDEETLAGKYINRYFVEQPEKILGTPKIDHGMYGMDLVIDAPEDLEAALKEATTGLPNLASSFLSGIKTVTNDTVLIEDSFLPYVVEGGQLYEVSRERGREEKSPTRHIQVIGKNGIERLEVTSGDVIRIGQMTEIARLLKRVYELDELGAENAQDERQKLNEAYSSFRSVRGPLNTKPNQRLMSWHPDRALLFTLEVGNKRADILSGPVARRREESRIENVENAVLASVNNRKPLNPSKIAAELGRPEAEIISEMVGKKLAFFDPISGQLTPAIQYLSGDVREKLRQAEAAARANAELKVNVQALQEVLPEWRHYDEIPVRLGKPFIPSHFYEQFLFESIRQKVDESGGVGKQRISVTMNPHSGAWSIDSRGLSYNNDEMLRQIFGTEDVTWQEVVEAAFNGRQIIIKEDGEIDEAAVADIEAKVERAHEWFRQWVFNGEIGESRTQVGTPEEIIARRTTVEEIYNNTMNSVVTPKFTGEGITFAGMAVKLNPRDWQAAVVQEVIHSRPSLVSRDVGGGKTSFAAMTVAKLQEIGEVEKGIIVVKKANLIQFENEIRRFFPSKRVLSTSGLTDWTAKHATLTQALTNHFDYIVMTYEDFQRIPIHPANFERLVRAEVERVKQAFHEELMSDKKSKVKQVERKLSEIEARVAQRYHEAVKDNLYQFDPDQQAVIKARLKEYEERAERITTDLVKNAETQLAGVLARGVPKNAKGKIAYSAVSEMRVKCPVIKWESDALDEELREDAKKIGNRVQEEVVTAVREIALERQTYLQDLLQNSRIGSKLLTWERIIGFESVAFIADEVDDKVRGMAHPEAPSNITGIKGVPDGQGSDMAVDFRMKMEILYKQCQEGGARHRQILMTATPIVNTAAEIYNWGKMLDIMPPGVSNLQNFVNSYLRVGGRLEKTLEGYKVETRVRGYDSIPDLVRWAKSFVRFGPGTAADLDPPKSQMVVAVSPITEYEEFVLQEIANKARNLGPEDPGERLRLMNALKQISVHTPLLYRDDIERNPQGKIEMTAEMITNISKAYPDTTHLVFTDYGIHENQKGVSAVEDFIRCLESHGIPRSKVINFSALTSDEERMRAQERLNTADAIVAIGSTARLGTGTNVQKRALTAYLLHTGFTPRNEIQCIGRLERPGNDNEAVQVVRVIKEGVDDFFAKYLGNKQEIITEFMSWVRSDLADVPLTFTVSDEALSAAQIAAIASRDHLALRLHELQLEMERIERKERAFHRGQDNSLFEIRLLEKRLTSTKDEIETTKALAEKVLASAELPFSVKMADGTVIEDREEAGKQILEGLNMAVRRRESGYIHLATFRDAKIVTIEEYSMGLPQRILIMDLDGRQKNILVDENKPGDVFRVINTDLSWVLRDFDDNRKTIQLLEGRIRTHRAEVYETVVIEGQQVERLRVFPEKEKLDAIREKIVELEQQIEARGTERPELDGRAKICHNSSRGFVEHEYREGLNVSLYRQFLEQVQRVKASTQVEEAAAAIQTEATTVLETAAEVRPAHQATKQREERVATEPKPSPAGTGQMTNQVILENPEKEIRILLGETKTLNSTALQQFVIHIGNYDFIAQTTGNRFGQVNGERTAVNYKSGWVVRWRQSHETVISKNDYKALLKGEEVSAQPVQEQVLAAPAVETPSTIKEEIDNTLAAPMTMESTTESPTRLAPVIVELEGEQAIQRFSKLVLIQRDAATQDELDGLAKDSERFAVRQLYTTLVGVGDWRDPQSVRLLEERINAAKPPAGKIFGIEFSKVGLKENDIHEVARILDGARYAAQPGCEYETPEEFFADKEETSRNFSLLVVRPIGGPVLESPMGQKVVAIQAHRYRDALQERLFENWDEIENLLGGEISDSTKNENGIVLTGRNGVWELCYSQETYGQAVGRENYLFSVAKALEIHPELLSLKTETISASSPQTSEAVEESVITNGADLHEEEEIPDGTLPNQTTPEIQTDSHERAEFQVASQVIGEPDDFEDGRAEETVIQVANPSGPEEKVLPLADPGIESEDGDAVDLVVRSGEIADLPVANPGKEAASVSDEQELVVGFVEVRKVVTPFKLSPAAEVETRKAISALSKKGVILDGEMATRLGIVLEGEMKVGRKDAPEVFSQMDTYFARRSEKIGPKDTLVDLRFKMIRHGAEPEIAFGSALKKAEATVIPSTSQILTRLTNKPGLGLGNEIITDPEQLKDNQDYRLVAALPKKAISGEELNILREQIQRETGGKPAEMTKGFRLAGVDTIRDETLLVLDAETFVYEGPDVFQKAEICQEGEEIISFGQEMAKAKMADPAFQALRAIEKTPKVVPDAESILVRSGHEFISVEQVHHGLWDFATEEADRIGAGQDELSKAVERHRLIGSQTLLLKDDLRVLGEVATLNSRREFADACLEHCPDSLKRRFARALLVSVERRDAGAFLNLAGKMDVISELPETVKGRLEAYRSALEAAVSIQAETVSPEKVIFREESLQRKLEQAFGLEETPVRSWGIQDVVAFESGARTEGQKMAAGSLREAWTAKTREAQKRFERTCQERKEMATAIEKVLGKGSFAPAHNAKTIRVLGEAVLETGVNPATGKTWKALSERAVSEIKGRLKDARTVFKSAFQKADPEQFPNVIRMFADLGKAPLNRTTAVALAERGVTSLPKFEIEGRIGLAKMDSEPLTRLDSWASRADHNQGVQGAAATLIGIERTAIGSLKPVEVSAFEAAPVHGRLLSELANLSSKEVLEGVKKLAEALVTEEARTENPDPRLAKVLQNFALNGLKGELNYSEFVKAKQEAKVLLEDLGSRKVVLDSFLKKDFSNSAELIREFEKGPGNVPDKRAEIHSPMSGNHGLSAIFPNATVMVALRDKAIQDSQRIPETTGMPVSQSASPSF